MTDARNHDIIKIQKRKGDFKKMKKVYNIHGVDKYGELIFISSKVFMKRESANEYLNKLLQEEYTAREWKEPDSWVNYMIIDNILVEE